MFPGIFPVVSASSSRALYVFVKASISVILGEPDLLKCYQNSELRFLNSHALNIKPEEKWIREMHPHLTRMNWKQLYEHRLLIIRQRTVQINIKLVSMCDKKKEIFGDV